MSTSVVELALKTFSDLTKLFGTLTSNIREQTWFILDTYSKERSNEKCIQRYRVILLCVLKQTFETIENIMDKGNDLQREIEDNKDELDAGQAATYLELAEKFCAYIENTKKYASLVADVVPNKDMYSIHNVNGMLRITNADNDLIFSESIN